MFLIAASFALCAIVQASPIAGDIELQGTIAQIKNTRQITLRVASVTLPNGSTTLLNPPRLKVILLTMKTAKRYTANENLAIEGKDEGSGKPLVALRVECISSFVAPINGPAIVLSPSLGRQVEDYNDLLLKIQDADHNWKASSNANSSYIKLLAQARTDDDIRTYDAGANQALQEMDQRMNAEKVLLRQAIRSRTDILGNVRFSSLYHETHLCLAGEDVFTDIPEAQQLRFIERRTSAP